jgi:hypothetical protein
MSIAASHQGRRDEATSWAAKADRFIVGGVPALEDRHQGFESWCLRMARGEARALVQDADFPTDPFAR